MKNAPLVIIGYGSQAKAWARNLRDSKREIKIALRPGSSSIKTVKEDGFDVLPLNSKFEATTFVMLTPDHTHIETLKEYHHCIPENSRIIYAHGYSFVRNNLQESFPKFSHLLLAPKAIASEVRFQFETNGKLGAAYSVEASKDNQSDETFLFELAKDLGITSGPHLVTFEEETNADLFSEQSILCSTLPYTALLSYNKLRERGVSKEIAYMECWMEVKLIADTLMKLGPEKFFELISPNALIGGEKAKSILFDDNYQRKLDTLLDDILDKRFFNEVDETNLEELRSNVISFWNKQELSQVHNDLKSDLYV